MNAVVEDVPYTEERDMCMMHARVSGRYRWRMAAFFIITVGAASRCRQFEFYVVPSGSMHVWLMTKEYASDSNCP